MKAYVVHYKNKFPGCHIVESEGAIDVYGDGGHLVSLRKNGAGQWEDKSEENGCVERHDLSPIPKDARIHKLHASGRIGLAEEAVERRKAAQKFMKDGKVQSIEELTKQGWQFDEKGRVFRSPKASEAQPAQQEA